MPTDGRLFASDYMAGQGYVFDLSDPLKPRLASSFGDAGTYTHPHSSERLVNGHTLATYQCKGALGTLAGALIELDSSGNPVRMSDASDPEVEPFIRPYGLQSVPKLDRIVTTSADLHPTDRASHVVQVRRLSDLKLLKTVLLPTAPHYKDVVGRNANEARLLEDGETVLVGTSGCGLLRLNGLAGPDPTALFVYDFGYRACAVPTVVSRYWVQTTMSGHSITSLDGGDPSHPGEVGHIVLQGDALPHWIGHEPGGNRLVIPGFGWLTTHVLFASIDLRTGALMLEPQDIVFDRQWPDGWSGPAMPNGAVFSNEPGAMRDK